MIGVDNSQTGTVRDCGSGSREPTGERELLRLAGQLVQRVNELEARIQDLEEWLGEIANDLLDGMGVA